MSAFPTKRELHRIWDYGTSYLSVGEQFVLEGKQPKAGNTEMLFLQDNIHEELPQLIGLVRFEDGDEFLWGRTMADFLSSPQSYDTPHVPIEYPKYLFYDTPATKQLLEDWEKGLTGWLDRPDRLQHLVVKHFTELRKHALDASEKLWNHKHDPEMTTTIDFFAVPEVLSESARCLYMECLRDAGFTRTRFISETEAAAAYMLGRCRRFLRPEQTPHTALSDNKDEIIVADIGGGTVNTSSFTATTIDPKGFHSELRWSGHSGSDLCGSEIATQQFYDHAVSLLIRQHGGKNSSFETGLTYLGMSQPAFMHMIADRFKPVKHIFPDINTEAVTIQREPHSRERLIIPVTRELLESCYLPVLVGTRMLVNDILNSKPKDISRRQVLCMTGGGSRNRYVYDVLAKYYTAKDVLVLPASYDQFGDGDKSVVRGAGGRFGLGAIQMPIEYSYGYAQEMYYDPEIHTDVPQDSEFLYIQPHRGNQKYVDDRWAPLVKKGFIVDKNNSKSTILRRIFQEYLLAEDDPFLRKQIYFTDRKIADHTYIYKEHKDESEEGQLIDGLRTWGSEITLEVPVETLRRYRKVWPAGKRREISECRYEVTCCLVVSIEGLNVDIEWCLVQPEDMQGNKYMEKEPTLTSLGRSNVHNSAMPVIMQRGSTKRLQGSSRSTVARPGATGPSRSSSKLPVHTPVQSTQPNGSLTRPILHARHHTDDAPTSGEQVLPQPTPGPVQPNGTSRYPPVGRPGTACSTCRQKRKRCIHRRVVPRVKGACDDCARRHVKCLHQPESSQRAHKAAAATAAAALAQLDGNAGTLDMSDRQDEDFNFDFNYQNGSDELYEDIRDVFGHVGENDFTSYRRRQ